MALFRYRIYDGHKLLFVDYINGNTEEDVLNRLEPFKQKVNGTNIKLMQVYRASEWSKECPKESG